MMMFKWSPNFDPYKETSLAPIWVLLLELPFHVFRWDYLRQVLKQIFAYERGQATITRIKPYLAKVRVEVGLMKPLPDSVFVGIEGDVSGLKERDQKLEYEGVPAFCRTCRLLGHDILICKIEAKKREQATTSRHNAKKETKDPLIQNQNNTRGENTANTRVQNFVKQNNDGFIEVKSKRRRRKKVVQRIQRTPQKMTPTMPIINLN